MASSGTSGSVLSKRGRPFRASLLAAALCATTSLYALPVRADGATPWEATAQQKTDAEAKFKAASKLYDKGEFDKAIELFQESYEIVASPNTALMIARSYREGGQLPKAVSEFQHVVEVSQAAAEQSDKYKPTLEAAQKELGDLQATMAHIEIELVNAPEGTKVVIDGEAVQDVSTPAMVMPGTLSVVATTPDGRETRQQVQVNAGQTKKVRLGFARAEEPEMFFDKDANDEANKAKASKGGGSKTLAYVAGGVGIAGFAAFGVFGAMSNSKYNDLQSACADNHCPPSRKDDIDAGKRFQTFANIGLAVGVVGVGTGAVLLLTGPSHKEKEKPKPSVDAQLSLGIGSIELWGRF